MASTGVIAEFGKKPPLVKVGIFVAIGIVLLGLYWQLVYSKLRADIKAEEANASALAEDERKVAADEKEYTDLKKRQSALEDVIRENDSALPTAAQLPAFFDMLNRKVGEASVEVRRWERMPEVQVDDQIFKVPVEIELQGSFYEIKKFFYLLYKMNQSERDEPKEATDGAPPADVAPPADADVEERDRILTIEDLRIGDPQVKNNELTLIATFRASTFRKEEPEPAAAPADDKKKAKDTKAKDTKAKDGAKPPAPSGQLGIPARSKEKVEDAMKKSEDRVENSGGAERVKGGM